MRITRVASLLVQTLGGIALLARTGDAQVVQGRVRDAVTGLPLDGAVVTLVVKSSGSETSVFSDSSGAFRVRATQGGTHTVEVKRISYEPTKTSPFEVDPGRTTVVPEVSLSPRPTRISTVEVTANQQCRVTSRDGMGSVGLWQDVRTALEATVVTASERRYMLRYTTFRRQLDERLREVKRESEERTARGAMVWASIPADQLAREGYIVEDKEGVMYRGLDAHVLLSSSFLESHCFKAEAHATNDSLVGLAFQPVRRGDRIDVRGVLWMNRDTRELDAIDFTYEGLKVGFPTDDLGGRIEFDQLPSGRWIVDRWYIRMPRVEEAVRSNGRAPGRLGQILVGFDEVGGAVSDITTAETTTRSVGPRPVIRGTVFDSTTGGPLTGARVMLTDSTRSTMTDERGFFSLDSVPASGLFLMVSHPFLDSLALGSWSFRVDGSAATRSVVFGLPPLRRLLARICRDTPLTPEAGVVVGNLGDATRSLAGIPVRVTWTVTSVSASGVKRVQREASDTTGTDGNFSVCGVPTESALRVELVVPGYQPESVAARIGEARRWTRLDIRVSR